MQLMSHEVVQLAPGHRHKLYKFNKKENSGQKPNPTAILSIYADLRVAL